MADFNALRDKVLVSLNTVAEKTKVVASTVADKAKDTAQIAKLNMEIASERDRIKKAYLELGKLYYDTHKDDPDGFFTQLCQEVTLSLSRVTALEDEIARLKAADAEDVDVEFENVVSAAEEDADCTCTKEDFQEEAPAAEEETPEE